MPRMQHRHQPSPTAAASGLAQQQPVGGLHITASHMCLHTMYSRTVLVYSSMPEVVRLRGQHLESVHVDAAGAVVNGERPASHLSRLKEWHHIATIAASLRHNLCI